nr:MAG TPA: hypothetical protein [Caudoviricetes sp.]
MLGAYIPFIMEYTLYNMDAWYFYTRFMHPVLVPD